MFSYFFLLFFLAQAFTQTLYNHRSSYSYQNQSWMGSFNDGIPLRNLNILGTHSSMSTGTWGDAFQTQSLSLTNQLKSGIRALDIRCRHYYDTFPIHERLIYLNVQLDDVLDTVQSFLNSYPTQVILMHIVEQYSARGNSQTFEETFIQYKNSYSDLIWEVTTQNPTLGDTRGKVVIIQDFVGNSIHGLLFDSFTNLGHKNFGTNWDQYDKWLSVKNHLENADAAGKSYLGFWTGSVGSFPYFVASGKSSPQNGAPRLATGLTTPGFSSYYPDFPRVACFIGICTIAFEGINTLAYNQFINRNYNFIGISFVDFFGDSLISNMIGLNSQLFGVCSTTQTDKGCTVCSVDGDCMVCNEDDHYAYDSLTSQCAAAVGYYLNLTDFPELCSSAIIGCLQCNSQTQCTLCDTYIHYQLVNGTCEAADGYYLDASSIPQKCSITGCYLCSSASVCTECSIANNYEMDSNGDCVCNSSLNYIQSPSSDVCICDSGFYLENGTCISIPLCPDLYSGCTTCSGSTCSTCDASSGFLSDSPYCVCDSHLYFDGTNCLQCNTTQAACASCQSVDLCTECVDNFTLNEGVCQCEEQYYSVDADTCHTCPVGCLKCTDELNCERCDENGSFILVSGVCECETGKYVQNQVCVVCGAMPGCLDCNMQGCLDCDQIFGFHLNGTECRCSPGHYISPMSVCAVCPLEGCVECDSATICTACNTSIYYLDGDECSQICGDGVLYNLECDDGNTEDGDGCSSNCIVEKDYTCVGGSSIAMSQCSYSGQISLTFGDMIKSELSNQVMIKVALAPALQSFKDINFQECLVPNFPYVSRQTIYDSQTGQITFNFTYNSSLNTKDMEVTFDPPETPEFFYTSSSKVGMPTSTTNNLALKYYSDEVYELWPTMVTLVEVLLYFTLSTFLLGFFFSSKLMAVEMIAVVQVAYIGLIMIDKLEALLSPLTYLWPINGYNTIVTDTTGAGMPSRIIAPGYKAYFFANFSINFIFVTLPLLIGLIIYFVAKKKQNKKYRRLGSRIMKEYQLSALLFVEFHLFASICLGCMYGVDTEFGIVLGILVSVGFIVYAVLLIKRPLNFGDYKEFFEKMHKLKYNYYLVAIIFRFLIVLGICVFNESLACTYFTISICLIQVLVLAVLRPYQNNFRPILNSAVTLLTIVIYSVYRLSITDDTEWITTYLPIILVSLLFVTILINVILMIRHMIASCRTKDKGRQSSSTELEVDKQVFEEAQRNWKVIQEMSILKSPGLRTPVLSPEKLILKDLKASKTLGADYQHYDAI